jgi:heme-degrading monooxygenase HmoA
MSKKAKYAVIFKAVARGLDSDYDMTAQAMRHLAMDEYGCLDFISLCEGDQEIAISYWPDMESIERWKNDPKHQRAQQLGRERWYKRYEVEVVEILRDYRSEQ